MTEHTEQEVRVAKAILRTDYNSEVGTTISDARFEQYWNWLTEGERSRFLRFARAAINEIREETDR